MTAPGGDAGDGDGVPTACLVVRPDWSVAEVDAGAERLLGVGAAAVVDRPLWHVLPDIVDTDVAATLRGTIRSTGTAVFEGFHPHLGAWLHVRAVPRAGGLDLHVRDVTTHRVGDVRATAALSRLALLARVSDALTSTDDADEAIGRLARLVVPHLADWSFVTVVEEDGQLRDLGLAHRDPRRYDDLAAYSARHLEEMSDQAAVWRALHGTEPVVVPRLSPEVLARFIPDPKAAALTRRLDPCGVASFPLVVRGRTFGALTLVTTSERGPHTEAELAAGLEVARRAAPVVEAARAAQRSRTLAESVQRSVLTVSAPGPDVEIAVRYRPASHDRQVGGDWYDAFALPDGSGVVTIGDVMGHDVTAIAAMAQLRSLMRGTAWAVRQSPSEVLTTADRASFGLGTEVFATAFVADLAPPAADGTITMTWSSAGHPPPAVVRTDGTVELVQRARSDAPLGVVPGALRRDDDVTLSPGDVVVLYTDGLVERRDRDLDVGIAALNRVLGTVGTTDIEGLLDTLLVELATDGVTDDIALLAARVRPAPTGDDEPTPHDGRRTVVRGLRVPSDPVAPAIGRDHVRRHGRALRAERLADAQLLVSELLGNAIRHGAPPVTLDVETGDGWLRVAVGDAGPGRPARQTAVAADATGGRGLLITEALASEWGVAPRDGSPGKTVWFRIDTDS